MSKQCPLCDGKGYLSNAKYTDKYKEAWRLKVSGLSFREVAQAMGMKHASQAKHLVDQYAKLNKRKTWLSQMVSRTPLRLLYHGRRKS